MKAILSQKTELVCACEHEQRGRVGVSGMVGMDEECQKAKEGERMKTKKKKQRSGLCPQNKDGERLFFFFFLNWPFPLGPRLSG